MNTLNSPGISENNFDEILEDLFLEHPSRITKEMLTDEFKAKFKPFIEAASGDSSIIMKLGDLVEEDGIYALNVLDLKNITAETVLGAVKDIGLKRIQWKNEAGMQSPFSFGHKRLNWYDFPGYEKDKIEMETNGKLS